MVLCAPALSVSFLDRRNRVGTSRSLLDDGCGWLVMGSQNHYDVMEILVTFPSVSRYSTNSEQEETHGLCEYKN